MSDPDRPALDDDPTNAPSWCARGDMLQGLGRTEEAISAYQRALQLDHGFSPAWYSLGCALLATGADAESAACFQTAVAADPGRPECHHNFGKALFRLGLADEAMACFRNATRLGGAFLPLLALATTAPGAPSADHAQVLEVRRAFGDWHLPRATRPAARPSPTAPLRVGYLSSFFHRRQWMKPVWGLINHHDRARVHVHLFSDAPESDCDGYRPQPPDRFHDISALGNEAAAAAIRAASLDLLVDLNGYSAPGRLAVLALRPAPITVGWFNMYATSGLECYDALIGDAHVVHSDEERFYTERILRVQGSYLTFEVTYPVPAVVDPPSAARGRLTFGCLASPYKITPRVVDAWSAILADSPGTTLFLKNAGLAAPGSREYLLGRFVERGVDPARIELEGPDSHVDFLAAYGHVDVALDPFPYNGGTTTMEALWQGVPVLTFDGDRWASRQSASILRTAGLDEFVAKDVSDYIGRAAGLAADPQTPQALTRMRRTMRDYLAASRACDTGAFARDMERLYLDLVAARDTVPSGDR